MKIFRTSSGAMYIMETVTSCTDYGGHVVVGYKVTYFSPEKDGTLPADPTWVRSFQYWSIDNEYSPEGRLVLYVGHKADWFSTSIMAQV